MKEVEVVEDVKENFLSRFLRALPFAPRGRRIVDETLRDLEHEAAAAETALAKIAATTRGAAAVGRALTFATAFDVIAVPATWLARRVLLFAVLPPLALVIVVSPQLSKIERLATTDTVLLLRLLNVISEMEVLLPVAFFLALAWPSAKRNAPTVGVAVVAFMTTLLLAGWIAPAAGLQWQRVAGQLWNLFHPTGPRYAVPDEFFYFYFPTFIRRSFQLGPWVGEVPFKVGLAILAGSLAMLGDALRQRRTRRLALLVIALAVLGALSVLTTGTSLLLSSAFMRYFAWPCAIALGVCCAIVVIRAVQAMRRFWVAVIVAGVVATSLSLPSDWRVLYSALGAGYAPVIVAVIVLVCSVRLRSDSSGSLPTVAVPPAQSIEDGLDEPIDRPNRPLMLGRRGGHTVELPADPGVA